MPLWRTDDELRDGAERVIKKVIELYDMFVGSPKYFPPSDAEPIFRGLRLDAEDYMSLDPQKIDDEFARMKTAASSIAEDAEAESTLNLMINTNLAGWDGLAAVAFKKQVDIARLTCHYQHADIANALVGLQAIYNLSVAARGDYMTLVEATVAAADRALGNADKNDTKAAISITGDLLGDLLGADPTKLVSGGLTMLIDVGKTVADRIVEGSDASEVIDSYVRVRADLSRSYKEGLETVRRQLDAMHESARVRPFPLEKSLPAETDVDSPNFSYDNFKPQADMPRDFGARVSQERERYANEKAEDDGTDPEGIRRVLGGGA